VSADGPIPPATFYLIRHGSTDLAGHTLAGRAAGVHLNAHGRAQAERLAERLAATPIQAVYSSPLERARETAHPLAARLRLTVTIDAAINELDFGDWTGRRIADLDSSAAPGWKPFNTFRSGTRAPGGEHMAEAQRRMVGALEQLRARHPGQHVALVGHADPIRATLAYFLGAPLDLMLRIEISPASISVIELADWGPRVLCVNHADEALPVN
jgi:probable phosphoglycerate mutase